MVTHYIVFIHCCLFFVRSNKNTDKTGARAHMMLATPGIYHLSCIPLIAVITEAERKRMIKKNQKQSEVALIGNVA